MYLSFFGRGYSHIYLGDSRELFCTDFLCDQSGINIFMAILRVNPMFSSACLVRIFD